MSFQLTRHVTLPRVPHTNIRYLGIEIYVFVFLLNITIFEGYLVLNVGKLGSYISFLVKHPTSFILYCVYPSIWSLYTVTLSPRIASAIQTKHKKSKMIFTVSQHKTKPYVRSKCQRGFSFSTTKIAYCAQLRRES